MIHRNLYKISNNIKKLIVNDDYDSEGNGKAFEKSTLSPAEQQEHLVEVQILVTKQMLKLTLVHGLSALKFQHPKKINL